MPRLSTHVLDTMRGVPASGMTIELHLLRDGTRVPLALATTNADGRTDAPLVAGDALEAGIYELTFHATEYFLRSDIRLTSPPFLGEIVIRFGIGDPTANYHVPLLLSPYGYSTYKGS